MTKGRAAMFDNVMELLSFIYAVIMTTILPAWFFYYIFGGFK